MDLRSLPLAVQNLATLGGDWNLDHWRDYQQVGIEPDHIPALIEIVQHTTDFWEDIIEGEQDPLEWTPMHAWRSLGQMKAQEAMPVLLDTLRLIDEEDSDLIQSEFPEVFRAIGPAAIPALRSYLLNSRHEIWARIATIDGLKSIALDNPETRAEITDILLKALTNYPSEEQTFNSFVASGLMDLKSVEAAPLVEKAFQDGKFDESILGDWEDFQVGVGLLERRLTHRHKLNQATISDGIVDLPFSAAEETELEHMAADDFYLTDEEADEQEPQAITEAVITDVSQPSREVQKKKKVKKKHKPEKMSRKKSHKKKKS